MYGVSCSCKIGIASCNVKATPPRDPRIEKRVVPTSEREPRDRLCCITCYHTVNAYGFRMPFGSIPKMGLVKAAQTQRMSRNPGKLGVSHRGYSTEPFLNCEFDTRWLPRLAANAYANTLCGYEIVTPFWEWTRPIANTCLRRCVRTGGIRPGSDGRGGRPDIPHEEVHD